MATTTNFGWETPDDTDLVKDGAAAIRTALGGVDTSFVDLKGGTTGQVLAKASNTDLDFVWSADAAGISPTIFDAKGDLIAASAADTAARLAVGTNGQVLTADSTAATGIKWAATGAPTFVGVSVFNTGTQSISDSTATFITFNSETYDTDGFHDTSTNTDRITIPAGKNGKYLLTAMVSWGSNATGYRLTDFQINGGTNASHQINATNGATTTGVLTQIRTLVAGDYIQLRTYQTSGGALTFNGTFNGSFTATYLGA